MMNRLFTAYSYLWIIVFSVMYGNPAESQYPPPKEDIWIETPNHTPVRAYYILGDWSPSDMEARNQYYRSSYPNAEFIGNASWEYNCHGYAWHISEFGQHVWIDTPGDDNYWTDGSYIASIPGQATKVSYGSVTDHSAISDQPSGLVISKWQAMPLMRHAPAYCPFPNVSDLHYYAPATPSAQPFAVAYDGEDGDYAKAISLTHDGGMIVAGQTYSFGATSSNLWLLKLDQSGHIPFANSTTYMAGGWQKRYGGTGRSYTAKTVIQAPDAGYVVAGYALNDSLDGLLLKVNANGTMDACFPDPCWSKVYNSSDNQDEYLEALTRWSHYDAGSATYTDGYLAVGSIGTGGYNGYNLWVFKVDLQGNTIWQKIYQNPAVMSARAYAIIQTDADGDSRTNDGYLVGGAILDNVDSSFDMLLLKLAEDGSIVWQKRYDSGGDNYAFAIQQTDDDGDGFRDDGYIVIGSSWVLKLAPDGTVVWQHTYNLWGHAIVQTADGSYVMAGDQWVYKLNQTGDILWANLYESFSGVLAMKQAADGSYVAAGDTTGGSAGWFDVFVLRIPADGNCSYCPAGRALTNHVPQTPVYSSRSASLSAAAAAMSSSSAAISAVDTASQFQEICQGTPPSNSYLLWTK